MIIWLVMHLNQLMFGAIDGEAIMPILQGISFIELLIEIGLVLTLIGTTIYTKWIKGR